MNGTFFESIAATTLVAVPVMLCLNVVDLFTLGFGRYALRAIGIGFIEALTIVVIDRTVKISKRR
jgi:hypothetical protein